MARGTSKGLAARAVSGAAWTILTGIGSRALGLVGTVVLTYYLARDVIGEVSDAAIITALASQFSTIGVGQYLIANPDADESVAWHATVFHQVIGWIAIGACLLGMPLLSTWMKAPTLAHYLPGLAVSMVIDRVTFIPERLLARDMRFRMIGIERTVGELSYSLASVALAMVGFGGMAIVYANIARSVLRLLFVVWATPRRSWLTPSSFSMATMKKMMGFGLPFSVGASAAFASRRFDNALISSLFGVQVVGVYNLAYNVADVPAVQVGEQIGDVLLPSFGYMDRPQQKDALVRSTGILGLIVFPLAVGLGAVAPTMVHAILRPEWADVGPMLMVLSALSVTRPVGWTIGSYLQARNRPKTIMILELLKLVAICFFIVIMGELGPLWACGGVGVAFAAHAAVSMWTVRRLDGITFTEFLRPSLPPLIACLPMAAAVFAVRYAMRAAGVDWRLAALGVEIAVGALTYIAFAFLIARRTTDDFLGLVRHTIDRRRGRLSPLPVPAEES
jgi:PST family polysaccharide transporter